MASTFSTEQRRQRAHDLGILVDPEDEWLLETYSWYRQSKGYIRTNLYLGCSEGSSMSIAVSIHHCIMGQPIWEGDEIDHEDRNPANNRRSNLRWADRYIQVMNSSRIDEATHVTQYGPNKFVVRITREGTQHYLGCFATLLEAVVERDTWLSQHMGGS